MRTGTCDVRAFSAKSAAAVTLNNPPTRLVTMIQPMTDMTAAMKKGAHYKRGAAARAVFDCYRVPNIVKHVCVAARIGEGKAPGAGNSYSYCQDEQRGHRRFWLQPFGLARVLTHRVVESRLLRMTKLHDFLLALSQNRDSASRVS